MQEAIENLPPKISKSDLCILFRVPRIRNLRQRLLTDDFIINTLGLDITDFNKRQLFSISESILIKDYLLELYNNKK